MRLAGLGFQAVTLSLACLVPLAGGAPPASADQSADYDLRSSASAPDGSYATRTDARLALRLVDGAWTGTCTGVTTTIVDGVTTEVAFTRDSPLAPPTVSGRLRQGDAVDPDLTVLAAEGCRQDLGELVVDGRHGGTTTASAATGTQESQLSWDPRTGLVTGWSFVGQGGSFGATLAASG